MSTRRHPRRDAEARYVAEQRLQAGESAIESVLRQAMSDWLDAARNSILYTIALNQPGLTAAGFQRYTPAASDAILATYGGWRQSLDSSVLPEVSVAFGEAFNAARKSSEYSAYRWQQEYIAEVRDRLVIWPEGAWDDIRPEIEEALAEGESYEEIKDRIGRVLNIDAATREIRADIGEVDKAIADPDTDPADLPELRQRRRELWQAHDDSLGEWEWKARRIARTEAHGAREGGALAAAKAMELATGDVYYKRWLSTDDERTRLTHRVADGQMVPIARPFLVGGWPLQHPGDPDGPGHEVIQCRCSLLIMDEGEVQDELQGPDGSMGEVRPGGMRLGPDDPDAARAAAEALAEERGVAPGPDRRADPSVLQALQPPQPPTPPVVAPAEQRGADIPDLTGHSQADLTDMMDRAYDAANWELFDAIEAELTRRDDDPADNPDAGEDQRATEEWLAAERQWQQDVTDWLDAEDQWSADVTSWLDAEQEYHDRIEAEREARRQMLAALTPDERRQLIARERLAAMTETNGINAMRWHAELIAADAPQLIGDRTPLQQAAITVVNDYRTLRYLRTPEERERWAADLYLHKYLLAQEMQKARKLSTIDLQVNTPMRRQVQAVLVNPRWLDPTQQKSNVSKKPVFQVNCQRCVMAHEMRVRGHDAVAAPNKLGTDLQLSDNEIAGYWNTQARPVTSRTQLEADLLAMPAGARVWVTIRWNSTIPNQPGGRHIFCAEVIGDGTIRYTDPQSSKMDASDHFLRGVPDGYMRVDNVDPKSPVTDGNMNGLIKPFVYDARGKQKRWRKL